ncbi:hypothetical protein SDC9_156976 [bioreactor metagenome]|uniref:Uncharacterized protein n=1 Tax=bioreactor metagenome TaxID=1076179 RepID=A0A645FAV7_9ZZZZ
MILPDSRQFDAEEEKSVRSHRMQGVGQFVQCFFVRKETVSAVARFGAESRFRRKRPDRVRRRRRRRDRPAAGGFLRAAMVQVDFVADAVAAAIAAADMQIFRRDPDAFVDDRQVDDLFELDGNFVQQIGVTATNHRVVVRPHLRGGQFRRINRFRLRVEQQERVAVPERNQP